MKHTSFVDTGRKDQKSRILTFFFYMRNRNFWKEEKKNTMTTNSLLWLRWLCLHINTHRNKQTVKRGPIHPHPSIHNGRKQEEKPGVLESLWELARGCMKTWIPFLTGFNYSHQEKRKKLSRKEQGYLLFLICKYGSHSFTVWGLNGLLR